MPRKVRRRRSRRPSADRSAAPPPRRRTKRVPPTRHGSRGSTSRRCGTGRRAIARDRRSRAGRGRRPCRFPETDSPDPIGPDTFAHDLETAVGGEELERLLRAELRRAPRRDPGREAFFQAVGQTVVAAGAQAHRIERRTGHAPGDLADARGGEQFARGRAGLADQHRHAVGAEDALPREIQIQRRAEPGVPPVQQRRPGLEEGLDPLALRAARPVHQFAPDFPARGPVHPIHRSASRSPHRKQRVGPVWPAFVAATATVSQRCRSGVGSVRRRRRGIQPAAPAKPC